MTARSTIFHRLAIAALLLAIVVLVAAGCGDDDNSGAPAAGSTAAATSSTGSDEEEMQMEHAEADPEVLRVQDITLKTKGSRFGDMLVDQNNRTIYLFEPDKADESTCYGECEEVWPPLLVNKEPAADGDLDKALGTTRRKDGNLQATYNGHPLYYMAGEKPKKIVCQAMELHGGLWYVIDPGGDAITKSS